MSTAAPAAPASAAPASTIPSVATLISQAGFGGEGAKEAFRASPPKPSPASNDNRAAPPKKPDAAPAPASTDKKPDAPAADTPPSLLPKKKADAPAPTPEAEPQDDFAKFSLPETATETQRSQFTELKRISREQAKQLKELQAKTASATPTPEFEKLKSEHQRLLDQLAIHDLKNHPDFKRQYEEPRTRALAEVVEVLNFHPDKGTVDVNLLLGKDLKSFNAEVSKLTEGMDAMSAMTVQNGLRQAYRTAQEEKNALAKSGELAQQLQQKAEAQARNAFREVASNLGPMGDFLNELPVPDGAPAEEREHIASYNEGVRAISANAEKIAFSRPDEKTMATLAHKAAVADFLIDRGLARMDREYKALWSSHQAILKELNGIKQAKGSGPITGEARGAEGPKTNAQLVAETYGKR